MKLSKSGIELLKKFEGFSNTQYICSAGYPTIGYGHKLVEGEHYLKPITRELAEKVLQLDVRKAEQCVTENVHRDISQNQYDALVCFTFNVGCGAFRGSTLLRLLNKMVDFKDVAPQFLRWNKGTVDGKKIELLGLTRRRKAEMELFLKE
jgi:lysozyme